MGQYDDLIRKYFGMAGVDPNTAVRVANYEGNQPGVWQSQVKKNGVLEPSYGPFQFLVGGPGTGFPRGLGNDFMDKTGLDPSDPKNAEATIKYAAQIAHDQGWSNWYGARDHNIGQWEGIDRNAAVDPGLTLTSAAVPGAEKLRQAVADDTAQTPTDGVAPKLPPPIDVEKAAATPTSTANPTLGDRLGGAIFGDSLAAKLKELSAPATSTTKAGPLSNLAGLAGAFTGKQSQTSGILPTNGIQQVEADQAARMQGASQLMATLLANRKKAMPPSVSPLMQSPFMGGMTLNNTGMV